MSGFSVTPVTQAGRLAKIKLNPEVISHLSVGETDHVCILHVNRPQISIFACLLSACNFFYHHSELKTTTATNNLKAHTGGEEGEGGNFRYFRLKFTLHSPRAEAKKKSHYREDTLPEFSASLLPLLTQCIWGASSTRTETFGTEPPNTDVTTRYTPKRQQAPALDQTSEGSPG